MYLRFRSPFSIRHFLPRNIQRPHQLVNRCSNFSQPSYNHSSSRKQERFRGRTRSNISWSKQVKLVLILFRSTVASQSVSLMNIFLIFLFRFAQENDLIFLETSAKTGESVEEAFLKCSKTILAKIETGELDPERIGSGMWLNFVYNSL